MAFQPTAELSPASRYSLELGLTEVGIGSILHALHVPFRGQALALNQAFVLSRASFFMVNQSPQLNSRYAATRLSSQVSLTAAALKSLSPVGKKLTPIFAITVQGFLFSLGQWILGVNVFGHALGAIFVSSWAFFQPLLIATWIGGSALIQGLDALFKRFSPDKYPDLGWIMVGSFLGLVWALSIIAIIFSKTLSEQKWQTIRQKIQEKAQLKQRTKSFGLHPLWIISLIISYGFIYFNQVNEDISKLTYLRPVSGLVLFWLVTRFFPTDRLFQRLNKRYPSLEHSIQEIKKHLP